MGARAAVGEAPLDDVDDAVDDVAAGGADDAVVAAAVVVATGARVPAATVVPCAVRGAVLAAKGAHPASASTRSAMPLRVRRIHLE